MDTPVHDNTRVAVADQLLELAAPTSKRRPFQRRKLGITYRSKPA
jgi:hypothetical protein